MTETFKVVLLLGLVFSSAESEDGDDAQRRILVSVLGGQDRLLTPLNVVLLAVNLLLTNITASDLWHDFPSLSTKCFQSLYVHCFTLRSLLTSLMIYSFLASELMLTFH